MRTLIALSKHSGKIYFTELRSSSLIEDEVENKFGGRGYIC